MKYLMSSRRNGVRDASKDEIVDEDFVKRFTSKETLEWFEGLGGTEQFTRQKSGVIFCVSTSPDGLEKREVAFTPQPEGDV